MVKKALILILVFSGISSAQMIMSRPRIHPTSVSGGGGGGIYTTGLYVYLKMDENTGTAVNDTQGNKNFTDSGATWVTGKVNYALSFNSTSNYIYDGVLDLPDSWSFQCWVWISGDPTWYVAFVIDNRYSEYSGHSRFVYINPNDTFLMGGDTTGSLTSDAGIPRGQWANIAGVFDNSAHTFTLYINGVQHGSGAAGAADNYAASWQIGTDDIGGNRGYFNGKIDEMLIYTVALTQTQVQQNYDAQK